MPTNIPALTAEVERVPRRLVIEEDPLADRLCRLLRGLVDEMVSCDPWRNLPISKGGDLSDAIDCRKLTQLYHDRVRHRVSEALNVAGACGGSA